MRRGRSTGNPTRTEAAWLRSVKHAGCVCCAAHGYYRDQDGPLAEAHHLLSGGIRRGHMHTVGLCAWHHRGQLIVNAWTHSTHRRLLGPSLAEGSVPFHESFGDDDSLMAATHELIARQHRNAA